MKKSYLLLSIALLLTIAAYANTLRYEFVYDDNDQIVNNPAVHSWSKAADYFTSDVYPHENQNLSSNYYRPVFQLWLLLNYKIGGLNAVWWHIASLLVHLVVVVLVFSLGLIFTRDDLVAAGAAALFGLHPIHIEAVTWISGVTEPLMAAFVLGSFLCYLRAQGANTGGSRRLWMVASLALFLLGIFEKETTVVLPAIIFCHQWLFSSSSSESDAAHDQVQNGGVLHRVIAAIRPTLPYLVLTLAYLAARYYALKSFGRSLVSVPLSVLLYTWPSVLFFYLKSLLAPVGLSAFYDTPYVLSPTVAHFVAPSLAILLLALLLVYVSRRSALVAFFSLWMIFPLLPLLNLGVFKHAEIAHDRYLYLPSVGFCVLIAYAIRKLRLGSQLVKGYPVAQVLVLLSLSVVLGILTINQNRFWATNLALYTRGVQVAPLNNMAATDYATEIAIRGNYLEAISIFHQVLQRNPSYWLPNFNLGFVNYQVGDLPEAEKYLRRAIQIEPGDPAPYRFLGYALLEQGKTDESLSVLQQAIKLDPDKPDQHFALGTIFKEKGNLAGALNEFRLEEKVNPTRPDLQREIAETEAKLRTSQH